MGCKSRAPYTCTQRVINPPFLGDRECENNTEIQWGNPSAWKKPMGETLRVLKEARTLETTRGSGRIIEAGEPGGKIKWPKKELGKPYKIPEETKESEKSYIESISRGCLVDTPCASPTQCYCPTSIWRLIFEWGLRQRRRRPIRKQRGVSNDFVTNTNPE